MFTSFSREQLNVFALKRARVEPFNYLNQNFRYEFLFVICFILSRFWLEEKPEF